MLAIRMQRTGRKGLPMYRVVVQDSRQTPSSGKLVAMLGTYNPHNKTVTLDKEKSSQFLNNGAQPSPRVISIFSAEGIKLPTWVEKPTKKSSNIRHIDKLRKNQPSKPVEVIAAIEPVAEEVKPVEAEVVESAGPEVSESTEESLKKTEDIVSESTEPTSEVTTTTESTETAK